MPDTGTWTIGRLLEWTTDFLRQHGAESPRLDAEVLLAHARGSQRIELYTSFTDESSPELRTKFRELVKQRAAGMPVAYLVGHKEFYSLDFQVTPDVLIPRPETELLVMTLLDLARAAGQGGALEIADVCTGSGIVAVCAAKHLPKAHITALDISDAALAVARSNVQKHGVSERVELVHSDLLAAIADSSRFDFIVANPPYVSSTEYEHLPAHVKDFEPRLALEAGPQGTSVIERLIPQAAERLNPAGVLLMEISPMIETRVRELCEADGRFGPATTVKDLAGLARVVHAARIAKA